MFGIKVQRHRRLQVLCCAGFALGSLPALAQLPPGHGRLVIEPPPADAPLRWLDGGRERRLVRRGPGGQGRTAVQVELADGRTFRAEVDAHALVRLDPTLDHAAATRLLAVLGAVPVRGVFPSLGLWRVTSTVGDRDGADLAHRLSAAVGGALLEATPDLWLAHTRHAIELPPDDPRYGGQWYLERIDIEAAWALSTGAPEVTILVVDGGCQVDHPDLIEHFDAGRDLADEDDDPRPEVGFPGDNHGTAVAGVAAAVTHNGLGVAGTCPECRLRCARLLPEDGGPVPISADVGAFQFALEADVAVVNNSWGFVDAIPVPDSLARAITTVARTGRGGRGALVVFAAGNDSRRIASEELQAVEGVVCVGATNNFDELTQFSNTGRALDVVAPTGTLTTDLTGPDGEDPGDYTRLFGGTSSAAPVVSGLFGLLVAAAPEADADTLTAALIDTAQQSLFARPDGNGHDFEYGYGVVRPALALRQALGLPLEPPAPDAGVPDAAVDAEVDAAQVDAAVPDAAPDARAPDAAAPAATGGDDGGCAQSAPSSRPSSGSAGWLLLAWAALRTPRRRR